VPVAARSRGHLCIAPVSALRWQWRCVLCPLKAGASPLSQFGARSADSTTHGQETAATGEDGSDASQSVCRPKSTFLVVSCPCVSSSLCCCCCGDAFECAEFAPVRGLASGNGSRGRRRDRERRNGCIRRLVWLRSSTLGLGLSRRSQRQGNSCAVEGNGRMTVGMCVNGGFSPLRCPTACGEGKLHPPPSQPLLQCATINRRCCSSVFQFFQSSTNSTGAMRCSHSVLHFCGAFSSRIPRRMRLRSSLFLSP
jgi:hypothetical protein